jgi:hypothetical protein
VFEGSFPPESLPALLVVFLMLAVLTGMRWNYSVVLICICFRPGMVSIFSCVFWPFGLLSFEKVLFSSVSQFFVGSLIVGEFSFLSSLFILVISLLSDV